MGVNTGVNELLRMRQRAINSDSPEQDPFAVAPPPSTAAERLGSGAVASEVVFATGTPTERGPSQSTATEKRSRFASLFRRISETVFGQVPESA